MEIGWGDVYKVVTAMAPLYVALALGYGSVKWWRMFNPDQCDAINRFNCYFIIPFFTFHFTSGVDPYHMNYRFLAGDAIAKAIAGAALALWANLWRRGNLSWAITSFSLSSLNNTLVVGVPLLEVMYGPTGVDLVVQSSVIQSLLWFPILLFLLEFWRATAAAAAADAANTAPVINVNDTAAAAAATAKEGGNGASSNNLGRTMKKVCAKLGKNPNCYACGVGLIWALIAKR
ncbi:Auxin efflux carrier component 5 [Sesamum alatum]|uniref:Auxin efflux carrier component 5 n=1 Tax=Sesamum alatum TaxID=300844 RepID=A0AAE1XJE8_9LAMI|nr:Auxin efflux carrier component 5 [Sesamum alatum]